MKTKNLNVSPNTSNKFKILGSLILLFAISACSSSQKTPDNVYRQGQGDRPLVDDKYSLQADRKALDDLRGEIPPERKRENDELALIMGLMSEVKKSPADIRSQFDSMLRKKRTLFDKDITKERETFTKDERKKREEFLKTQRDQREVFGREKHSREERAEFFKTLDEKRSEFFSVERDRRNDFESDVRERRKSFEDYAREKQNEFNQEMRAYHKRYDDMKKAEREKEKALREGGPGASASGLGVGSGSGQSASGGLYNAGSASGGQNNFQSSNAANGMSAEALELEQELEEIKKRPGTSLQSGE